MGSYKCTFSDGSEALVHYGVLGMRWGVRHDKQYKAQRDKILDAAKKKKVQNEVGMMVARKTGKYSRQDLRDTYKRHQREIKDSTKKAINKAKVDTANRLYSTNSQETNRRIQTASTGKTLAKSALMGSYGALHYTRARGEGYGRGRSAVRGVLSDFIPGSAGPLGVAGLHNYAVDRAARERGERSGKKNKRYIN